MQGCVFSLSLTEDKIEVVFPEITERDKVRNVSGRWGKGSSKYNDALITKMDRSGKRKVLEAFVVNAFLNYPIKVAVF